jgi:hypothetical protein
MEQLKLIAVGLEVGTQFRRLSRSYSEAVGFRDLDALKGVGDDLQ